MQKLEHKKWMSTVLDFGEAMMRSGAEVSRIEDSVSRICAAYGYERVQLIAISAGIILTVTLPDGDTLTQLRRCYGGGNNFSRLSDLNALSRDVCVSPPSADEFKRRLDEILKPDNSHKNAFKRLLGAILAACSCTVFFGGSLADCPATAVCAILIFLLDAALKNKLPNASAFNFISALLSGLLAASLCSWLGFHLDMVIIGIIMLLIPGILLTNSMRDMLLGDTLTGSARLFEAVLGAACLAAGITVAILLFGGVQL